METSFSQCLRSEWMKLRRSLVGWLILGAAFFVPSIIFAARLRRRDQLPALYLADGFWERLWIMTWESIAIMILPMTIILVVSLILQIEYRNNTWKQLHASPQTLVDIFAAKLFVILIVIIQLFVLFNLAIFISAMLPALLFKDVPFPVSPIPGLIFLDRNLRLFADCLPIVAFQFLLSLRFRNFMVPMGVGMAIWIFSVGTLNTSYNYYVPYSYLGMDYLVDSGYKVYKNLPAGISAMAFGCSVAFTLAGYVAYAAKDDKG